MKENNPFAKQLMNTQNYYSMGIDSHKSFCQIHILHPNGSDAYKGRINQCDYKQRFAELVAQHCNDHPCKATFESSTNWHVLYDLLSAIEHMEEVIMAHPLHVKYICQAQLKNDKVDALKLAQLLRLGMIPRAHATGPHSRHIKELVRQRAAFVQRRTALRNRTHRVLGACPEQAKLPQCSDLFGAKGLKAMKALKLPEPHQTLLRQNLASLDELAEKIKECEQQLVNLSKETPSIQLLQSMPGLGKVLACVIAAEVDGIERFDTKKKFIGYCGLAPTTHGSAGKFHQGKMIAGCNKWLKWAFIEAAWVAIGCDNYLGSHYKNLKMRGKKANTAITNVAHRMAQIAYEILRQQRPYEPERSGGNGDPGDKPAKSKKTFPARSKQGLVGDAA